MRLAKQSLKRIKKHYGVVPSFDLFRNTYFILSNHLILYERKQEEPNTLSRICDGDQLVSFTRPLSNNSHSVHITALEAVHSVTGMQKGKRKCFSLMLFSVSLLRCNLTLLCRGVQDVRQCQIKEETYKQKAECFNTCRRLKSLCTICGW